MAQLSNEELASIAHDFYLGKLNIGDISQKYNLSRYLITKALEEAEEQGIVKITIQQQTKRDEELERKFMTRFGLKEAVILQNLNTTNEDNEKIVDYAAQQIQAYTKSAHYVGITWGTLLFDIINRFDDVERNDLTFVQLVGNPIHSDRRKNPLVQKAAARFAAQSFTLPLPIYVLQPEFIEVAKKEPFYQTALEYYHKLDLLFTGIGTYQSFAVNNYLNDNYGQEIFHGTNKDDIAGMIFGRPYNIEGKFIPNIENHICGISLDDIRKTPVRFVVVKNRFKTKALLGALRTGMITHLITNAGIAERVLREIKS